MVHDLAKQRVDGELTKLVLNGSQRFGAMAFEDLRIARSTEKDLPETERQIGIAKAVALKCAVHLLAGDADSCKVIAVAAEFEEWLRGHPRLMGHKP